MLGPAVLALPLVLAAPLDEGLHTRIAAISEAIAAPRASQRNTAKVTAEPDFITAYGGPLAGYGHAFTSSGDAFTSAAEIGAATAIEFGPGGRMTAAAEPVRRGGGSAMVLTAAR